MTKREQIIREFTEEGKSEVSRDGLVYIKAEISEEKAQKLEELSAKLGVPLSVIIDEAMALLFREAGMPLTPEMAENLEAHGRPIPHGAQISKKGPGLN
jgi:hypothetical protein